MAREEYTDRIREAVGLAGAGTIGEYTVCSFTSHGTGTYIPSSRAVPFEGETGKLSRVDEDRLEMVVPSPLVPSVLEAARKAHPYDEMAYDLIQLSNGESSFGYGAVGTLKEPMKPSDFIKYTAETLGVSTVRTTLVPNNIVQRVAVMGGNGSDFISQAVVRGADAYVTGDLGYHDFIDCSRSILLIDASHQATEFPVLDTIRKRLLDTDWGTTIDIIIERGESTPNIFEYTIL